MAVYVAFTIGCVFWIVAWAFGVKAFDAFLVTLALTLAAASVRIYKPLLDKLLGREQPPAEPDSGF
jgi:hypothetical protein